MHTHLPAHLTAPCLLGLQCFQLLPASAQGASLHAVSLCPQPSFALQPHPAPTWSRGPDLSSSSRAWQMPSSGSRNRSLLHRHEARPGHAALRAGQLHRFPAAPTSTAFTAPTPSGSRKAKKHPAILALQQEQGTAAGTAASVPLPGSTRLQQDRRWLPSEIALTFGLERASCSRQHCMLVYKPSPARLASVSVEFPQGASFRWSLW